MDSCTYLKGAHIKTAKPSVHCNEQQVSVVQVKTSPPVKAQHLKEKKMLKKKKKLPLGHLLKPLVFCYSLLAL